MLRGKIMKLKKCIRLHDWRVVSSSSSIEHLYSAPDVMKPQKRWSAVARFLGTVQPVLAWKHGR